MIMFRLTRTSFLTCREVTAMSERYKRLFTLPENLYSAGAPAVIAAGALLQDNMTGRLLAQLKIRNIQDKYIKAVKVRLFLLDTAGRPLGEEIEHQYLDVSAARDTDFGQKSPAFFPDVDVRAFSACVTEVVYEDNTIWTGSDEPWEALSAPESLEAAFKDDELMKQYLMKYGENCRYLFRKEKDLWRCACGAFNHQDEENCHICQKDAETLAALDIEALKEERDLRLEEEAKQAAERKAAEEARKKKYKIIAAAAVIIVIIAIIGGLMISRNAEKRKAYDNAAAKLSDGDYRSAQIAFERLGDYKDSADQAKEAAYKNLLSLVKEGDSADFENEFDDFVRSDADTDSQKDRKYRLAEALAENGYYEEAAELFDALGDYKDSEEQAKVMEYEQLCAKALEKYSDGESYLSLSELQKVLTDVQKISSEYKDAEIYVKELTAVIDKVKSYNGTYHGKIDFALEKNKDAVIIISDEKCKLENFNTYRDGDGAITWKVEDGTVVEARVKIAGKTDTGLKCAEDGSLVYKMSSSRSYSFTKQ